MTAVPWSKTPSFLDKLIARCDRIDKDELLHVLKNMAKEKVAMQSVLHVLGDGILLLDTSGKILFANRSAVSLLGWEKREVVNSKIKSVLSDRGLLEIFTAESVSSGQSIHREVQVYTPRPQLLSIDLLPMWGEEAEILGTAAILNDITEKRRLEGRMMQSEKLGALSILAAGLAHEIGNPLNSINIHLQLLDRELKKAKGLSKTKKVSETMQGELKRLDEIVHRFLSAIRPLKPKFDAHSINDVIKSVLRVLKPELTAQKIDLQTYLSASLRDSLLDAAQIKQALINIFKNAIQAMPKGGTLSVRTAMREGALQIRVGDTGTGIEPENLSKIFDPYFTTREKGVGLGLMMTHRIVKGHGGDIEVKSQPGQGTEMILTLPLRSATPKMISDKMDPKTRIQS